MEECEEIYEDENREVRLLSIRWEASQEVRRMLQNLVEEQEQNINIRNKKSQEQLPIQYETHNTLFKLVNQDWKVVLSNKMLHKLIKPVHESLPHASALKCYLCLREDFTINNMFSKIKNELKSVMSVRPQNSQIFTYMLRCRVFRLSLIHI